MTEQPNKWRNRIVGYGEEKADQLLANEANWRIHPKPQQDTLSGILDEVGWVQNVIINRRTSEEQGKDRLVETLVDGHLRVSLAISHGNDTVPVTYVDLTPNEEKLILATIDPISAMAVTDKEQLDALLREIDTGEAAVQKMLSELAATNGLITPDNPYEEYLGMPDYEQETIRTFHSIKVHFETESDMIAFARLISQTVTDKTTYIYYPKQEKIDGLNYRVIDES